MKKNPDGSYTLEEIPDDVQMVALEERVAALEMFILTFSEAMSEDDDGGGQSEFANEQRRWREAHVAARARRQRERAT